MRGALACGNICRQLPFTVHSPVIMAPATNLPPSFSKEAVIYLTVVLSLALVVYWALFSPQSPSELPLVGEPAGRRYFSLRTRWRYYTDCASLYNEGYQNVRRRTALPSMHLLIRRSVCKARPGLHRAGLWHASRDHHAGECRRMGHGSA
jgi:hypothetical protein